MTSSSRSKTSLKIGWSLARRPGEVSGMSAVPGDSGGAHGARAHVTDPGDGDGGLRNGADIELIGNDPERSTRAVGSALACPHLGDTTKWRN